MTYYDVFVSYSSHDEMAVSRLVESLERKGLTCWFSGRDLAPGVKWTTGVIPIISSCGVVVFYWTANAVSRPDEITREISYARGQQRMIIPYKVESVSLPPELEFELQKVTAVQAYRGGKQEPYIEYLARTIKAHLASRPPFPPPFFEERPVEEPDAWEAGQQPVRAQPRITPEQVRRVGLFVGGVGGVTVLGILVVVLIAQSGAFDAAGSTHPPIRLQNGDTVDASVTDDSMKELIKAQQHYCSASQQGESNKWMEEFTKLADGNANAKTIAAFRLGAHYTNHKNYINLELAKKYLGLAKGYTLASVYMGVVNNTSNSLGLTADEPPGDPAKGWKKGQSPYDCDYIDISENP